MRLRACWQPALESGIALALAGGVLLYSTSLRQTQASALQKITLANAAQHTAQQQADQQHREAAALQADLSVIQAPPVDTQLSRLRAALPPSSHVTHTGKTRLGSWEIDRHTVSFPTLHEERFVDWSESILQHPGLRIHACQLARHPTDTLGLEATCTVHWFSWRPASPGTHLQP